MLYADMKNGKSMNADSFIETIHIDPDELDNHFTKKLNDNLFNIQKQLQNTYEQSAKFSVQNTHRGSDSPFTMSSDSEGEETGKNTSYVNDIHTNELSVMDVLTTYFRCQKYIYEQSNILMQSRYNGIFGVVISMTSSVCIFISFLETYRWRTVIIVVFNAIVTILLVMTKHLKLEQNAELYLYLSRQCEFIADNIKHVHANKSMHSAKIRELETRLIETRDIPNIIIPQSIQVLYPVSSNVNIFSFIKKVNARILFITEELNKVKYEIDYILRKYKDNMGHRENNRMHYLLEMKENLKKDLKLVQTAYVYLEEIFTREINRADYYGQTCEQLWCNSNTDFAINHSHCNSFVDEYIAFILPKK